VRLGHKAGKLSSPLVQLVRPQISSAVAGKAKLAQTKKGLAGQTKSDTDKRQKHIPGDGGGMVGENPNGEGRAKEHRNLLHSLITALICMLL